MAKHIQNDEKLGALVTFKDNVPRHVAEEALRSIGHLIDINKDWETGEPLDPGDYVRSYDPRIGGPVWYIP